MKKVFLLNILLIFLLKNINGDGDTTSEGIPCTASQQGEISTTTEQDQADNSPPSPADAPPTEGSDSPFCSSSDVDSSCSGFGTGTNVPQAVCVPILAYEPSKVTLTWTHPDVADDVVGYNVYKDGQLLGNSKNNSMQNSVVGRYFDTFLKEEPEFYPKILFNTFWVKGLKPKTKYTFTVRSVLSNGEESEDSKPLVVTTPTNYKKIVDISKVGAVGDGKTMNTKAIQDAIDSCATGSLSPYDCKIRIPRGTFLTGSITLKSNMTLELASGAVLLGSPNSEDYPMIPRLNTPSALINVIDSQHSQNLRIVSSGGAIEGNGWLKDTTIIDEIGNPLPHYVKGSPQTVKQNGVLAASQVTSKDKYGSARSKLLLLLGITNLHIGGTNLTLRNPSMMTIAIGNSRNISVINTCFTTFDINNGDGIDLGDVSNVQILSDFYDTGDDAIAMGTGQGKKSNSPPVEFVVIRNNYFRHSHGCSFGGNLGDWVQDVQIEDNIFLMSDNGIRMKATKEIGGGVRRVCIRNIGMKGVGTTNSFTYNGKTLSGNTINGYPLIFTLKYSDGKGQFPPSDIPTQYLNITLKDLSIDQIDTNHASGCILIDGTPNYMHTNFEFKNIKIKNSLQAKISQLKLSVFDTLETENISGDPPFKFAQCSKLTFSNAPAVINPQSNYS